MKKLLLIEIFLAIIIIVNIVFIDTISALRVISIEGWISVIIFSVNSIKNFNN